MNLKKNQIHQVRDKTNHVSSITICSIVCRNYSEDMQSHLERICKTSNAEPNANPPYSAFINGWKMITENERIINVVSSNFLLVLPYAWLEVGKLTPAKIGWEMVLNYKSDYGTKLIKSQELEKLVSSSKSILLIIWKR